MNLILSLSKDEAAAMAAGVAPSPAARERGCLQCDISTGTIIWRKSVRLTPPRIAWLMREWP